MKKVIVVLAILFLSSMTALAQENSGNTGTGPGSMGGGQQQQQAPPQQQYNPNQMYPGMMGGYGGYGGYGMGPGMMGGYGGYGGYGMGPGMMGGYGYGMGPGMMGGYGSPPYGAHQGPNFRSNEEYSAFLNQTKEQRQKLHNLMFEYNEALLSPEPDRQKLQEMEKEIYELRNEIANYKVK